MSRAAALLALALAAGAAGPAGAQERYLAVLDLTGPGERAFLGALTDRIRGAAADALRGRIRVITRDEIAERLSKNGRGCDAGEEACTIELGRVVGADLVLTGRVLPVGARQDVTLQLHDSVSGALVASESRSAGGALEALDLAPALVHASVRKLLAPPPPIGTVEPGNYLEVRALGAVTSVAPRGGDLRCGGRCVGSPADLLVGYRFGGRWAVELGLLHTEYYRSDDPQALRGTTDHFVAGVEWSPGASRFFSVAGYAGLSSLARELRDGPAVAYEDRSGWVGGGELRLKLNLRIVQLGLRAGARAARQGELVSPGGTRRLRAGTLLELPVSLSFRLL